MTAGRRRVPRVMLVTDRRRGRLPLAEVVTGAVAGGVDAVQVREPDLGAAELAEVVERVKEAVGGRAAVVVNGNTGVAAGLGVGVHLPERGMATAEARRLVGERLLGRSVHSVAAATVAAGADYLLAGHVFETASKPGRPALGLDGLGRIVEAAWEPVLAIGGITVERVAAVAAAGATGVAVVGAIAEAADPERAAAALRRAVDEAMEAEMGTATVGDGAAGVVAIVVNGKPVEVEPETTVTDFLADKGLRPTMAVVELNGRVVARRLYDETVLAGGDRVEVVHAVGGG